MHWDTNVLSTAVSKCGSEFARYESPTLVGLQESVMATL